MTTSVDDGGLVGFECAPGFVSRWVCEAILCGQTYPHLAFVPDVRVVFDVGANCGATTVFFARHHPDAVVHSFEPARGSVALLRRNTSALPNVEVHPIGLHSEDMEVPLYFGAGDAGMASILQRDVNVERSEPVQIRAAGPWALEHDIERIDILKVDVEGCEVPVLRSLEGLLPTVKVLYVEYDSRADRRAIEDLLADTHELFLGVVFLDQGECVYIRRDLAGVDGALERLTELAGEAIEGRAAVLRSRVSNQPPV